MLAGCGDFYIRRSCTKHVSRAGFEAKDFLVLQCLRETNQQVCSSLETIERVLLVDLEATRHDGDIQLSQTSAVDLAGLFGVAAESSGFEHLQTGDCKAFAASVNLARFFALVLPLGSGAGVEENRH